MGHNKRNMGDDEFAIQGAADAGASTTYPLEAGQIRKGGFIMIKGNPCKVVDVSTSKTGKHGHAKCHFVAINIFNGKKAEELCPSTHNAEVPLVNRKEYQVISDDDDNSAKLKEYMAAGDCDVMVTVLSACGKE